MLIIGLTGGIGSGKSSVAKRFAALDVPVIDADDIAHEIVGVGQPALQEIAETFGQQFLNEDGTLNRTRLRRHVFSEPKAREQLESMLHPRIQTVMMRRVRELTVPYCILVIPLLIEAKQTDLVDRILVVDVEPETQRKRIAARDGLPDAEIDRETRLSAADDIIRNEDGWECLDQQVTAMHKRYLAIAGTHTN
jgi:dephospho-CoA kinase